MALDWARLSLGITVAHVLGCIIDGNYLTCLVQL